MAPGRRRTAADRAVGRGGAAESLRCCCPFEIDGDRIAAESGRARAAPSNAVCRSRSGPLYRQQAGQDSQPTRRPSAA